jgi:hypothetical protein
MINANYTYVTLVEVDRAISQCHAEFDPAIDLKPGTHLYIIQHINVTK